MKKLVLGLLLSLSLVSALVAATPGLSSITFTTSQAQFVGGDSITVTEILATSPNLAVGDTFVIRGTYVLQSQTAAIMSISMTTTTPVLVAGQTSARRQVSGGSGTFEMEYIIQNAGSLYIAFTPAVGSGGSFGRIYFAGSGGTGPTTPGTPTTPTTPTVTPVITTEGLSAVPFVTSRAQFLAGDSITIQEVLSSSPRMEPGDRIVVRGQYTLQSLGNARLGLSLTINVPGILTPVAPTSRQDAPGGSGTFELAYEITQPGALHVTFYPIVLNGPAASFGGVYFAPPAGMNSFFSPAVALADPLANTGKLGNLSVRSTVSAGDGALVAGISVTEQERYVLIRGIGPSLGAFGVSGVLRKPVLSVYAASGEMIASTGSWSSAFSGSQRTGIEMVMRSVGAFPLTTGSEDAVLNLRLVPGSYTVSVGTGDGQSGVALLEVYASATFSLPNSP